jgi:hypothetical protein
MRNLPAGRQVRNEEEMDTECIILICVNLFNPWQINSCSFVQFVAKIFVGINKNPLHYERILKPS